METIFVHEEGEKGEVRGDDTSSEAATLLARAKTERSSATGASSVDHFIWKMNSQIESSCMGQFAASSFNVFLETRTLIFTKLSLHDPVLSFGMVIFEASRSMG